MKPQDIVVLAKLLVRNEEQSCSQNQLATELRLSPSQVNAAFKRLKIAGMMSQEKSNPIIAACREFLIHGLKFVFPAKLGALTRGIPTSYAAAPLNQLIPAGKDPIPVWPSATGSARGLVLKPLYQNVPLSITEYPDPKFYELLTLLDAIRSGRARERQLATQLLEKLFDEKDTEVRDQK